MATITGTTQYWAEYVNTSYGGTAGRHTPSFAYTTSETDTTFTVSLSSIQASITLMTAMAEQVGVTITYKLVDKATLSATGQTALSYTHTKTYPKPIDQHWGTHTATFASSASFTWNKTSSPQAVTISLSIHCDNANDGNPSAVASVSLTVPALQSYPVTYYSNNGSGSTQTQNKYHSVDLTLSPATPTFAGYTFRGWATSIAHAQVGTVDYETGDTYSANAALNLFAVWELTYSKPVITNLTIERCTSSGTLDDEGKYAKVSFSWSVFKSASARYYGGETYPYSNNSVSSCTVTVGSKTKTPTLSGDSGTASVTVGNNTFDVDTQYSASVSITDSQSIVQDKTTTVTGTLSTTAFPLDYNAAGSAAGMFRPAPDNGHGLYVGDDIHSSGDIDASGDMNIGSGKHYKINGTNLGASDVGAEPTISNISESSGVYSGGIPDEKLLTADTITALEAWLSS